MFESAHPARPRRANRSRAFWVWLALAATVAAAWYATRDERLPEGVSRDEYRFARQKYEELYGRRAGRLDALSLAGELAVGDGRLASAAACFRAIPSDSPRYGAAARLQEGQVLFRLNRAREAEHSFREFIRRAERDPALPREHLVAARKWLCHILSVELRLEERKVLLADVHADGQADVFDSKQFYFPNLLLWHSSTGRRRLSELLPDDAANPLLLAAEGRYLTAEGRLDEALVLLHELHARHPTDRVALAAWLECLFERNDWSGLAAAAASLPGYETGEPWLLTRLRGEIDMHSKHWESAVEHFKRVLEADPANPGCHMALARAYAELRRPDDREESLRRSVVLARIRVNLVNVTNDDYNSMRDLAAACAQIGLDGASAAFEQHAAKFEHAGGPSP